MIQRRFLAYVALYCVLGVLVASYGFGIPFDDYNWPYIAFWWPAALVMSGALKVWAWAA